MQNNQLTTKRERWERAKEEARARSEQAALETKESILRLLEWSAKRSNLVIMEEPDPTNTDAVTNMCRAVSKATEMAPEKFVLVLAHSPEAAVRVFRLFYERTTLRVYLDVGPEDDDDDDDDDSAVYFNALYSWVKHRVVIATPATLKKKIDAQGPELVFQISLVVLCDTFRMKPQDGSEEDDTSPDDSGSPLILFIDTLKLLSSSLMTRPVFLNPVDCTTTETTAEFLWDNEANKVLLLPDEDAAVLVVQRKIIKKYLKVSNPKRIIDRRSEKALQQPIAPSSSQQQPSLLTTTNVASIKNTEKESEEGDDYGGDDDDNENENENSDDDDDDYDDDDDDYEENEDEEEEHIVADGTSCQNSKEEEINFDLLNKVDVTSYIRGEKIVKGIDYIDALIARSRKKGLKDPTFVLEDGGISVVVWDAPNELEASPGTLYRIRSSKKGIKKKKKDLAFCTLRYLNEHEQSVDLKDKPQTYNQRSFKEKLPEYSGDRANLGDGKEPGIEAPREDRKEEAEKAPMQTALDALEVEKPKLNISRKPTRETSQEAKVSNSVEIKDVPEEQIIPDLNSQQLPQLQPQQVYTIDFKNELQTFCQRNFNGNHPDYSGNKVTLPDGREFTIDRLLRNRKETEKALAQKALEILKMENPDSFQTQQKIPPPTTSRTMDPWNQLQTYCQKKFGGNIPRHNENKVILPDGKEFTTDFAGSKKEVRRVLAELVLETLGLGQGLGPKQSSSSGLEKEGSQEGGISNPPEKIGVAPLNQSQPPIQHIQRSQQPQPLDPKNRLQTYCQCNFKGKFPVYKDNKVTLPDGREFTTTFIGSKKETEKVLAQTALDAIEAGGARPQDTVTPGLVDSTPQGDGVSEPTEAQPQEGALQPLPYSVPSAPNPSPQQAQASNSKNELQSYCQRVFKGKLPEYDGSKVTLPDGREFTINFIGSKKAIEKELAQKVLDILKSENPGSFQAPQKYPQLATTTSQPMDPCNQLQTYCQRKFGGVIPKYSENKVTLPDGKEFTTDFAGNKKEVRKVLAQIALGELGIGGNSSF